MEVDGTDGGAVSLPLGIGSVRRLLYGWDECAPVNNFRASRHLTSRLVLELCWSKIQGSRTSALNESWLCQLHFMPIQLENEAFEVRLLDVLQ